MPRCLVIHLRERFTRFETTGLKYYRSNDTRRNRWQDMRASRELIGCRIMRED